MISRFQYAHRAAQIALVCLRNLVQILLSRVGLAESRPGPERLRGVLEELGGSLLKFGQILSLQIDTLPREYCDALLSLLDRVPPFPREQLRQVFVGEWSKPPEELYLEFDYEPLASASIGQVHRATMKDGTNVAVKVQRPGVQELFRRDGVLLQLFVRIVFFFRLRSLYFMRDPVREFNEWLGDELDYRREAAFGEVLGRNAAETPTEKLPKIHWELTTSRVLTMDFLPGRSVLEYLRVIEQKDEAEIEALKEVGFDAGKFLSNVIRNFLSDAFRFGVFHADLHPANLLILKDNVVGYVDFGIVGHLTPEARRKLIELSMAYASGRSEEIYAAFLSVSTFSGEADLRGFRRELEQRCRHWYREPAVAGVPHLSKSLTTAMFDLLALCRNYGLLVDREMIKYIRSLILVDGLVSRLEPQLDVAPQIRQVCEDFYAEEAQSKMFSRGAALNFMADLSGWLLAGPGQLLDSFERLERRQFTIRTRPARRPGPAEANRAKAIVLTAVWLTVATALLVSYKDGGVGWQSPIVLVLITFWGGWTIWILKLLRGMGTRLSRSPR